MTNAVILDYDSLAPEDLDLRSWWQLPLNWQTFPNTAATQVDARLQDVQIVLTNKVRIDRAHLRNNPAIQLIVILATGTNNVDLEAARESGVAVCNIVNYSTHSVVQHTIGCLLALATNIIEYNQASRDGSWSNSPFFCLLNHPITELYGKSLGIIGFGAIGRGVAQVAEALGMKVAVAQSITGAGTAASEPHRVPLDELLKTVDVLSLHCPLSSYSRNLIDKSAMSAMKRGAWILNMSRGGIVVEKDLIEQLHNGHIGAAALDTIEQEPPALDNPLLAADIPNLILTPHSAWGSRRSRQNLVAQTHTILSQFLSAAALDNRLC